MNPYQKLLLGNKAWVQDRLTANPQYFERTGSGQQPEFLWIGCSDSHVPAEEITGAEPGELFVHRNIGNLVVHTDVNLLSVLQYAVEALKVPNIIVCGHYLCEGVKNAMLRKDLGILNNWLRHVRDLRRHARRELETIVDDGQRWDRLVELNVAEQVQNLAETATLQRARLKFGSPQIHGWVYDPRTGGIKEIASLAPGSPLDDTHALDLS